MGANNPVCVASLDPRGMILRIYVGYHQIWLHTNIQALGLVVSEKNIFYVVFFNYKPMATVSLGVAYLFPQGHGW